MTLARVKVLGVPNLRALSGIVDPRVQGRKLAELAEECVATAKLITPVDTGRLRDSEQARVIGKLSYAAVAQTAYAAAVEFGTSRRAAQPFMRPAAEEMLKLARSASFWRST